ncbi:hypothetical protein ACLESO_55660 [Pyxidicoccus sp. 3LG]
METVSPRTALARLDLSYSLLRALDRPAREALELARRPLLATVAPALLGLFLVATASTLAGFVSPEGFQLAPRLDGVRAVFESLLVVVPGTLVFASYLRLRVSPRAFLAATSIGLLAAGLMAACVLPLMAFFVLVAHDAPGPSSRSRRCWCPRSRSPPWSSFPPASSRHSTARAPRTGCPAPSPSSSSRSSRCG